MSITFAEYKAMSPESQKVHLLAINLMLERQLFPYGKPISKFTHAEYYKFLLESEQKKKELIIKYST